jgi:hypothetical protein
MPLQYKRYPDKCVAVVRPVEEIRTRMVTLDTGRDVVPWPLHEIVTVLRRGPCGHDKVTALARYKRSGLIADARTD